MPTCMVLLEVDQKAKKILFSDSGSFDANKTFRPGVNQNDSDKMKHLRV